MRAQAFRCALGMLAACSDEPSAQIIAPLPDTTVVATVELRMKGHELTNTTETKVYLDRERYTGDLVLRQGTVLPEHHSEVPVTIEALQGAATVDAGGQQLRIDATHAVVLAAKVPHAVKPDPGTDVVLLVSHLGRDTHHQPEGH